jgi:7-cyano-7-deazaguanine synthase
VELDCAKEVARSLEITEHEVVRIGDLFAQIGPSALATPDRGKVSADATGTENQFAADRGLPSTFVPGRNLVMLSVAASWGLVRGATELVTGICAMDAAGYPDCRAEFAESLEQTMRIGLDSPGLTLHAPLLTLTKSETWALADQLGVADWIAEETHTCYNGNHTDRHAWGFGCGECPACDARATGFSEWQSTVATS